jgi:broad specificity phosphatase PhoE
MRIYLVRHASHALLGRSLCGRTMNIGLGVRGCEQADALARYFSSKHLDLLQSSPQRRTRETAQPIAAACRRNLEIAPALDELDAGDWSGQSFEALARDPRWRNWNDHRASGRAPGGESMRELQTRVVRHIERTASLGITSAVMVTHAEPIRAALMHYRGIALDDFHQVAVEPASVSVLDLAASARARRPDSVVAI